ncbi:MAG TPA: hypothetical protein VMM59_06080 [Thermohalobaculum sp.]|nr:hypothetical protein [Thermohalobaculum sp.]
MAEHVGEPRRYRGYQLAGLLLGPVLFAAITVLPAPVRAQKWIARP